MNRIRSLATLMLLPLVAVAAPPTPNGEAALRKARVGGKYEMLLAQLKVPKDAAQYADFHDLGSQPSRDYAGVKAVPAGHWVYVEPYWYVWRDLAATPKVKRSYGPEQVCGPPDTAGPGDIPTAWASATPDGEDEWLTVEYEEVVVGGALLIHETYNPGAVVRVTGFRLDGEEVELWKGKDPTDPGAGKGISEIPLKSAFKSNRYRIYIDSRGVPGWNEIDAVALRDASGRSQWAARAEASTTYAQRFGPGAGGMMVVMPAPVMPAMPVPPPVGPAPVPAPLPAPALGPRGFGGRAPRVPAPADNPEERIKKLEDEVRDLKDALKRIEDRLKKPDK